MASNREGRALFVALSKGDAGSPVYLIHGEETFLVEETVKALVQAVLPDGADDFSHQVIDGGETPGLAIRQTLENLPLFGGRRLIHVRNIAAMPAKETEALQPYLDRPAPETTLLMTDRTIDFRKRFFKAVKASKNACVVQFRSLYSDELAGWVERRGRQKELSGIDRDLAELVVALAGPELSAMDSALDKVSLYVSKSNVTVSEEILRTVLDDTRTRSIFELTRQIGDRDVTNSLNSLHRMLSGGESAVAMVAMIARHFRIVWRVAQGTGRGLSGSQLARHAGCPPMFLGEYERDTKRFGSERLIDVTQAIHDAERKLKSSALKDGLVMDELILRICM